VAGLATAFLWRDLQQDAVSLFDPVEERDAST
jgi:hypothetical protein